jgi:predicted PurR-regulated permease PerM
MSGKPTSAASNVVIAAIIVAALYFGREVLLPIALAVLLSFVLAPLVRLLQHTKLPRPAAVLVSVLLCFGIISGFAALMFSQISHLAERLPVYQSTLAGKIETFRGATTASGPLKQASQVLDSLRKELNTPKREAVEPLASTPKDKPIPVEVHQPAPGALETLSALIAPLIQPLATSGIVVIFVIFILMQQQDLRSRLIKIAGSHDLQRTTLAMDDAGQRLSRLFLTQLALNACFGLIIGVGLWLIGVPSAPLWGLFSAILRFVPYVGAIASAIFPLILATAAEPGWTMTALTAALFLVVELLIGQVAEPFAYGHSSGLSPVAVVISATFWTWLWGPVGLILATPLTVCLVVAGRHVERLRFIETLLGDQPALSPSQIIYQRLLAGDPIEATEQARGALKEQPLSAYYQDTLLGGLRLAWADAQRGLLEQEQLERIRDAVHEMVDEFDSIEDALESERPNPPDRMIAPVEGDADIAGSSGVPIGGTVLCIPGAGILDEAAAMVMAQILRRRGIPAEAKEADTLSMAKLFALDTGNVSLVCLCYLEQTSAARLRYAVRRIHRQALSVPIIVALLDEAEEHALGTEAELPGSVEWVRGSLASIADCIQQLILQKPASLKLELAKFSTGEPTV